MLGGNIDSTMSNCILYSNNGADTDNQIYLKNGADCDVGYCCIQGGFGGIGNIQSNPLLNRLYHLSSNSPCIDSGDPLYSFNGLDIDRELRINDGDNNGNYIIDMGADEYYP